MGKLTDSSKIEMNMKSILGSWVLQKHGYYNHAGQYHCTSEVARGQLIYTADNLMSVLIVKVNAPESLNDVIAYSGRFSVTADTISHHIQYALRSEREGTTECRNYCFENDQLILVTEDDGQGYYEIVWGR